MNHNYCNAIHNRLLDIKDKIMSPVIDSIIFIDSLSLAVSDSTKLVEQIEHELQDLLNDEEISENDKKRIKKDWDSARNHFNRWISDWRNLFKEINMTAKINCVGYFRPLEMIQ